MNVTTGDTLLEDQTEYGGEGDPSVVDGFFVVVSQPLEGVAAIREMATDTGLVNPPDGEDVLWSRNHSDDWYVGSDVDGDVSRMNWRGHIGRSDWEFRFTAGGSGFYDWDTDAPFPGNPRAPFEIWNIGEDTPDDPSDDVRINFSIIDDDDSGGWSWGDRIYPWEVEYTEPLPATATYNWDEDFRIGRIVFNDYSEVLDAPVEGTVVRFVTSKGTVYTTADTMFFSAPSAHIVTTGGSEGQSIYLKYKLYNKGGNSIDSYFFCLWADPDLGGASDDLVGCDSLDNVFFCYNGTNADQYYGALPPAVGFKVIHGPVVPSEGDTAVFDGQSMPDYRNLGMAGFAYYFNGVDPNDWSETYNHMRGLRSDGSQYINPTTSQPTTFQMSGDPVTGIGDVDYAASDRRMMAALGPFTFNPGDSQYVLVKMSAAQGSDRLTSLTALRNILNQPFTEPTCCGRFTGGMTGNTDCGADGKYNLTDIVRLIDRVYLSMAPLCCELNGNTDGDSGGALNLSDIMILINYVYLSGAPPAGCL